MIKSKLISNRLCVKRQHLFIDLWFEIHKDFSTDDLLPIETIYHVLPKPEKTL